MVENCYLDFDYNDISIRFAQTFSCRPYALTIENRILCVVTKHINSPHKPSFEYLDIFVDCCRLRNLYCFLVIRFNFKLCNLSVFTRRPKMEELRNLLFI